ncbi:hypothetical protein PTTG_26661 [Puccinia triticina 1-1 BBBD Race 1]|uniref:GCM domain-containing protein n=1 Tax=Puccinia triticina (isolate 1-1 / race 1 (BBBD)) TaxID=630390 RepID=A0A180GSL3_PUCT1|nr:hypothetical protein PTTG_26661 [Puccinia triticina 1-1 BBBD Race 1]
MTKNQKTKKSAATAPIDGKSSPSNVASPSVAHPIVPVKKTKLQNWEIPHGMDRDHQTFIDHNCVLNKKGYPIYPNRQTSFVLKPGNTITNFGYVGYSKKNTVDSCAEGAWKVRRYKCLGVMLCNNDSCDYTGPPPTGRGKIREFLDAKLPCEGSAGECPGTVYWKECKGTCIRFDTHKETGWGLMRYHGYHDHPWPTAKKADPLSRAEFSEEIKKNPKASALELKVGAPNPDATHQAFTSVVDIHESFGNSDRLRYLRREILRELNLGPENKGAGMSDKFIMGMFDWDRKGMHIISLSYREGKEHFTFQTQWMAERLLARSEEGNKLYSGGLLSDVTYRFFDNGYLLTTSMYCNQINRWIPVQLSWIRGLTERYYQTHFAVLFKQFITPSILQEERDQLLQSVVDFSSAQRNGFIAACMEVFNVSNKAAISHLKGCHHHFQASVTRIKQNRSVIMADEVKIFETLCHNLLLSNAEAGKTHEERIDKIRRCFPKDSPNGDDGLPNTTNAQESMHRVYYMFSAGKKHLFYGMVELYGFVKALEKDYNLVMRGMPIDESIGWKKPTKQQRAAFLNNGRAPDTTDKLVSERPDKRAKGGRPPNAPNIDRGLHTTFVLYAASKKGHKHFNYLTNRCWLVATLELLFAVYSPLWLQQPGGKAKDLFFNIVSHFSSRSTFDLTPKGSIQSTLTNGSKSIFDLVNQINPASFVPGEFSSADRFMEMCIDTSSNSSKVLPSLFRVHESREFLCPTHPEADQKQHPWAERTLDGLKITREMFEHNHLQPANVTELFTRWTTNGLSGITGLQCQVCNIDDNKRKTKKKAHINPTPTRYMHEKSTLSWENDKAPLHLYAHVNLATIPDDEDKLDFMAKIDWPFNLTVAGKVYTLISRGFWGASHYWGKVLRHVNGITGVWLHNDRVNNGHAQLVNRVPGSISGLQANTSWVIYSKRWTPEEEVFVDQSIANIAQDNPRAGLDLPFSQMRAVLYSSCFKNEV